MIGRRGFITLLGGARQRGDYRAGRSPEADHWIFGRKHAFARWPTACRFGEAQFNINVINVGNVWLEGP